MADRIERDRSPGPAFSAAIRLIALSCLLLPLSACRRPTGSFKAERIPKGSAWHCWMGRCDRACRGVPGPADATGFAPEPVCAKPKTAFCITYEQGAT